jgi:hypothetical protein
MSLLILPYQTLTNTSKMAIEENCIFFKAMSFVPVIGAIFSWCIEASLDNKLSQPKYAAHFFELIELKNQYKAIHAIRNTIEVALIITCIAVGLISGFAACPAVLAALFLIGRLATKICQIRNNKELVEKMQSTGMRPAEGFNYSQRNWLIN